MAVRVYATTSEYATWLGQATPPANADRLLRGASLTVDAFLTTARYDVDDDGYPTDTSLLATLRDATCAQAEYMAATGDTTGTGYAERISSASIGSLSYSRNVVGQSAGRWSGVSSFSPMAWQILAESTLQFGTVGDPQHIY